MRKKTTEEFISESIAVHGDKYDYTQTVYVTSKDKVKIICNIHGEFHQSPSKHIDGQGCRKCGIASYAESQCLPRNEFIKRAKAIHGDFYDYSLVEYRRVTEKVKIICPVHGVFEQNGMSHLCGKICLQCSKENNPIYDVKRLGEDVFLERAVLAHGSKYDYSKSVYKNCDTPLIIICPVHGEFLQSAYRHWKGTGCPSCNLEYLTKLAHEKRLTKDMFISKAMLVHSDKYDYSLVVCEGVQRKVDIICPTHGVFKQVVGSHLYSGRGCPACAKYGYDSDKTGYVYLLKSEDMLKVGITNKDPTIRLQNINKTSPQQFNIIFSIKTKGNIAREVEAKALSWLKEQHKQPTDRFDGYKESFYISNITLPQIIDKLIELEIVANIRN